MSVTPILSLNLLAPTQADKTTSINDLILAVEGATNDQLAVSLSTADVSLTTIQFTRFICFVTSGNSVSRNVVVPRTKRVFAIRNAGTADVVVGFTAGSGVTVAGGDGAIIQSDGTVMALLGSGGPGPTGDIGPAGPISTIVAGAGMIAGTITSDPATIEAQWQIGTITSHGAGIIISGSTIDALVSAVDVGIDINSGTISARWQATETVTALGDGFTVIGGTLLPASFATAVHTIVAGAGLAGGTITSTGTIALAAIANDEIQANISGSSAAAVGVSLSGLLDSAAGSTQGEILYRSGSAWTVLTAGTAGQFLKTGGAGANPSWAAASPTYTVGFSTMGTLTANQVLLTHTFREPVTLPSALGATSLGHTSEFEGLFNSTSAWSVVLSKCAAADDPTDPTKFVQFGTVTYPASGHTGTITTAGTSTSFAAGDRMGILVGATADATAASIYATIVGDRS